MAENIQLNKPKRFIPSKNHVAEDWHLWKEEFLIYLELASVDTQLSGKQKAFLLLNLMGEEAIKAKNKMSFDNPCEMENMEILLMKFDHIFDPPTNEIEERYKFFSRYKDDKESIDYYVAALQEQAKKCNFGNQVDKFIVDMIILNMNYYLQQHVFTLEDTSLLNTVLFYKKEAITEEKIKNMYLDESKNSDYETDAKKTSNNVMKNSFCKNATYCVDDSNKLFRKCTDKFNDPIEKNKESINNSTKKETQNLQSSMFNSNDQSKANCSSNPIIDKEQICQWCESRHGLGECLHDINCTICDKFPHNICFHCRKNPHDNNCYYKSIITLPKVMSPYNHFIDKEQICQWCESRHGRGECLHDANCTICDKFPHNICFHCRKNSHDNNCYYKSIITLPKVIPPYNHFIDKGQICQWCESRHGRGECLHDANCTICDKFPHNICFQCRKNPHDNNCYYKSIITLPELMPSFYTTTKPDINACSRCGTKHITTACPTPKNDKCKKCNNFAHLTEECPLYKNFSNRQNFNTRTNTAGPSPHTNSETKTKRVCSKCGTNHPYMQCPAYNKKCSKCGMLGHYNWTCHKYMDIQDTDSDEAVRETQRKQPSRRRQRRQNYSKKDEEAACCIS